MLTRSFRWIPPNLGIHAFTVWDGATARPLTERLLIADDLAGDEPSPDHAEFSADGSHLLSGRLDGESRVTQALQLLPPPKIADRLPDLAEVLAGYRLADDGNFMTMPPDSAKILKEFR